MEENDKLVQFIFNHKREVIAEKDENTWRSYIMESEILFSSAEHARTYYHYASDEMGFVDTQTNYTWHHVDDFDVETGDKKYK